MSAQNFASFMQSALFRLRLHCQAAPSKHPSLGSPSQPRRRVIWAGSHVSKSSTDSRGHSRQHSETTCQASRQPEPDAKRILKQSTGWLPLLAPPFLYFVRSILYAASSPAIRAPPASNLTSFHTMVTGRDPLALCHLARQMLPWSFPSPAPTPSHSIPSRIASRHVIQRRFQCSLASIFRAVPASGFLILNNRPPPPAAEHNGAVDSFRDAAALSGPSELWILEWASRAYLR
jgi:hypothetical protein